MERIGCGPIDLFESASLPLFVKFCARRRVTFTGTELCSRFGRTIDYLYTLMDLECILPSAYDRAHFTGTIRRLLCDLHLPDGRGLVCRTPSRLWHNVAHACLAFLCKCIRRMYPALAAQVSRLSCVVVARAPRLALRLTNMSKFVSDFQPHLPLPLTADTLNSAALGHDLFRLNINGRCPILVPFREQKQSMTRELKKLCKTVGTWLGVVVIIDFACLPWPRKPRVSSHLHLAYASCSNLTSLTQCTAFVQEDKDPNTLWMAHPHAIIARWLSQFSKATDR